MKASVKLGVNRIVTSITVAVLAAVLLMLIFVFAYANLFHYTAKLESDIASETLLTTILFENRYVTPATWYASTTPRIISVPNLAALLYPLASHNAILATGISCVIMMLLLLGVMSIFYRQIGFSWAQTLASLIIVMSFTNAADEFQRMLFLYASYYVSHIISLFIILIFYNMWLKENRVALWTLPLSLFVAVLNGMQGMHGCMFCYIPLVGTEIIRRIVYFIKDKRQSNWLIMIWTGVLFGVSFGTAKVLDTTNVGASRNIRHAFSKFIDEVCPTIYNSMSLDRLPIVAYIILLVAIIGYVIYIIKLIIFAGKKYDDDKALLYNYRAALSDSKLDLDEKIYLFWSILVFLLGFLFSVFLETFTTADVAGRYFLPLLFVVSTGFALFIHQLKENEYNFEIVIKTAYSILTVIVAVYGILSAFAFYTDLIKNDNIESTDEYQVYSWMVENGYPYGYTTFDFANSITVMGNNAVKVRAVNNMSEMEGCKWLSDSRWYPPVKSEEGETCYIVTEAMTEDFQTFLEATEPEIVGTAEIGKFTVYVLDHDYTLWER